MASRGLKAFSLVLALTLPIVIGRDSVRMALFSADAPISKVILVDKAKKEIQVNNPRTGPFNMGEKLSIRLDGQVVVLRVTFPMMSLSRCVIEKGKENFYKITKGMPVFRGTIGEKDEVVEERGKPGEVKKFAGIEMIKIPAGSCMIGDSKQRKVTCNGFWMGRYEVTQKQYESIMGTNPSHFKNKPGNPVEMIAWYNAIEFCNKLSEKAGFKPYYVINKNRKDGNNKNSDNADPIKWTVTINKGASGFRLPTSEEWIYACKGGTTTAYFWGDSDSLGDKYVVFDFGKGSKHKDIGPRTVGSRKANPWGLYDMSGNVWEMCYEWDGNKTSGFARKVMGGSWNMFHAMPPEGGGACYPGRGSSETGFRIMKDE